MQDMNILGQKMKEEFTLQAVIIIIKTDRIIGYLNL